MKRNFFAIIFDKITDLLFPKKIKCIFCGKDINNFEEKPYCDECEKILPFNNGARCKLCDMEIVGNASVCDLCKHSHKHFDKVRAPFKYEREARSLVLKFKDGNAKYLAEPMARLMFLALPKDMKNFDIIIPVPMTASKLKKRGYNQASLLAREIALLSQKPMREDILLKVKDTKPQKELSFKERQKNLDCAFKLLNRKDIKGKKILLVDDVMTTSATANVCSELLKKYCSKVFVCCFARNEIKFDKKNKKILKKHLT